jgi:hemerythrin-like domain-containing protein
MLKSIPDALFNYYNFLKTYTKFIKYFGNNVHIIIYENLFKNTSHEIDRLLKFVEKDIEPDLKKTIEENNTKVINRAKRSLNKEERDILPIIQERYEESNKELSSLIGFDLSQYGYHE